MLWRYLVITVKLAQFLIDRAQDRTNRFRILPGVSRKNKIEKEVKKKSCYGCNIVITIRLANS